MITSRSNPLIKQAHALKQRKKRSEQGLFLVEGILPVGEAVGAGWEIESILYSPTILTSNFATDLISRVSPAYLQQVSAEIMETLCDKENPQGILAIVHQKKSQIKDLDTIRHGAAIVSPQDPGNVGTILRTLDAVNGDALLLLDGGVDPFHPTSVRASMGTIFWTPIIQTSFVEFLGWSVENKIQVIGTSAHGETDYRKIKLDYPWILLFGSEQKGLSQEYIKACKLTISLPMHGHTSSLNLGVAAGILLYRFAEDE